MVVNIQCRVAGLILYIDENNSLGFINKQIVFRNFSSLAPDSMVIIDALISG